MVSPPVGVLALQGNVREHLDALQAAGARPVSVRRQSELDDVEALVIPGGESTTIDKLLRAFELREPVLKRLADGMPAYGSCAGMILLADRITDIAPGQQSLGGIDMTVRRNAFGRQIDSFERDLHLAGVTDPQTPFRAVFIRAPWVESVGADVEILARTPSSEPMSPGGDRIVAVRQGNLLATSFHPELTGDGRVHQLFVDMVRGRT